MKEIKINIEGCTEDVYKVLKHLEQGGFLTQKNMSSGINKEGMNTTAAYEVMPEDRNEDRTEIEPFMPKKGEVCTEIDSDGKTVSIFIATGEIEKDIHGGIKFTSYVALYQKNDLLNPYIIELDGESLWHYQEFCHHATKEEIDLLLDVLSKAGYFWDPIGCKLIKNKYEPKNRERYFAPDFCATVDPPFSAIMYEWQGLDYDMDLLKKGWVFRTKEEAQALCDKLNKAIDGVEV